MAQLSLPETPKHILATEYNDQESQVMNEGNSTYFIDRYEYPEKGGILVYKYGGEISPVQINQAEYEAKGQEVLKELTDLMARADFNLVGQDQQSVMLIPNAVIRAENQQQITNRVDLKYPEKGFPDPLAVSLANKVKRVLKVSVDFFAYKWTVIAFFPFLLLPFKFKIKILEKWLDGFSGYGRLTLDPRIMKPKFYTEFVRELLKFVELFLLNLGISKVVAERTAWVVAEVIERDNAYRWRAEDLLTETTSEQLIKDPRKEIWRLVRMFNERERNSRKLGPFVKNLARLACLVTYHPRIRKALNKTLRAVDFKNFQYDPIDRHAVMKYAGYDFFGIPYEARIEAYNKLYEGNPPRMAYVKV